MTDLGAVIWSHFFIRETEDGNSFEVESGKNETDL